MRKLFHSTSLKLFLLLLLVLPNAAHAQIEPDPSSPLSLQSWQNFMRLQRKVDDFKNKNENKEWIYDLQFRIPHAFVDFPLSHAVLRDSPKRCESLPFMHMPPKEYFPGEIPCGEKHEPDDGTKSLYEVDIPAFSFTYGTDPLWNVEVPATSLSVNISRAQLSGPMQLPDLNSGAGLDQSNSQYFGLETFTRNNKSGLEVCVFIPGVIASVSVGDRMLHMTEVLPKTKAQKTSAAREQDFNYHIEPAVSEFTNARVCNRIDLQWGSAKEPLALPQISESQARIELLNPQANALPYPTDLAITNLIQQHDSDAVFAKLKMKLTDHPAFNWASTLIGQKFGQEASHQTTAQYLEIIKRIGTPWNETELLIQLRDRCHLLQMQKSPEIEALWTDNMQDLCHKIDDAIFYCEPLFAPFTIAPWASDPHEKEMGCELGFANIFDLNNGDRPLWWTRRCALHEQIHFRLPSSLEQDQKEFDILLGLLASTEDRILDHWQRNLVEQQIDRYQIWQVLDELQEQLINKIEEWDWQGLISELIPKLK